MLFDCFKKKCRGASTFSLVCLVSIILLTEWLEYLLLPIMWPKFPFNSNSIRLLIVSDPQLLGYSLSPPGLLGSICRWDADRYVSKTFNQAHEYIIPDLVIFMGDNLDEGEIAEDKEFYESIRRFRSVFEKVNFHKAIIIPGDNDIGGEDQPPSPDLERRFNKYFREDVFITYHFLEFVKVNYIAHSNQYLFAPNYTDNAFRIALSHLPLTPSYSTFVDRVIPYLKPHLILSAHDHKSGHWIVKRPTGFSADIAPQLDVDSFTFNLTESLIHEIMVPTCSYRMGTDRMGYGALELSPTGEAFYAVLWLPSRFRQLYIHLFAALCFAVYLILILSRAYYKSIFAQSLYKQQRFHFVP